jgi:hypothetical protein
MTSRFWRVAKEIEDGFLREPVNVHDPDYLRRAEVVALFSIAIELDAIASRLDSGELGVG